MPGEHINIQQLLARCNRFAAVFSFAKEQTLYLEQEMKQFFNLEAG